MVAAGLVAALAGCGAQSRVAQLTPLSRDQASRLIKRMSAGCETPGRVQIRYVSPVVARQGQRNLVVCDACDGRSRGAQRSALSAGNAAEGRPEAPPRHVREVSVSDHAPPRERTATRRLAELVRDARSVVALTGAGISVPSGIADFRTPRTGLWAHVDPMEVAHIDAFHRDAVRFWEFYGERFATLGQKRPNGAHEALVELERRGLLDGVITQNVDMLHRKAGTRELVEVHGSIAGATCLRCGERATLEQTLARIAADERRRAALLALPRGAEAGRRAVRRAACRRRRWSAHASCASGRTCCCASAPRSRCIRSRRCRC